MNIEIIDGKLLLNGHHFGEVLRETDGFYVWWPPKENTGYFSQQLLLSIVVALEQLNAPWTKELDVIFSEGKNN